MTTRTIATTLAIATVSFAAAALAACGSPSNPTTSTPPASTTVAAPTHNQADTAFATDMIRHHTQAVSMSKLAADHASSPQLKDLATRIEAAQQPEIDQMSGYLRAWNSPVPNTNDSNMGEMNGMHPGDNQGGMGNMPGMNHGGPMPGMMSPAQMQQLDQAHSAAFDTMFLQMMISHHQGAITMSKTELATGQNPDARTLAQNIITAQQREITEMQTMLNQR